MKLMTTSFKIISVFFFWSLFLLLFVLCSLHFQLNVAIRFHFDSAKWAPKNTHFSHRTPSFEHRSQSEKREQMKSYSHINLDYDSGSSKSLNGDYTLTGSSLSLLSWQNNNFESMSNKQHFLCTFHWQFDIMSSKRLTNHFQVQYKVLLSVVFYYFVPFSCHSIAIKL